MTTMTRRALARLCAGGAMAAAAPAWARAQTRTAAGKFDPTPHVHPELRAFVPALLQFRDAPAQPVDFVKTLRGFMKPGKPDPAAREVRVPGPTGAPPVRLYVLNERTGGPARPAILYIHGGGFIAGDAAGETGRLLALARDLDCVVVSVDYRLAPEAPFPGPVEDCHAALGWMHREASRLGIDPRRVAVMGESAGGGLAAMLTIMARDRATLPPLAFQLLVYPMLDDRTGSTRRVAPPVGYLTWTEDANRAGWGALLGRPAGAAKVPPGSVPARVERLAGLPPAFIGVGSIDLFVSEDIDYARRLVEAGVPTELLVVPGAFHGFQSMAPKASISRQFNAAIRNALANAFTTGW
jgi:acetyl esterase/lipase